MTSLASVPRLCKRSDNSDSEGGTTKAGVGIAQGFLFARPLPIEIFEESYLEEK